MLNNTGDFLIIAEVSQNHDGSLGQAHAFIDAVATTGANAIKFQTHIANVESSKAEPFRVKFSYEDNTRYEYWKRMEFTEEQWVGLYRHAIEKGLVFLSSPFSIEAFKLLDRIGVPAWKIGSGEVFNYELLKLCAKSNKPVFLSTGLSTFSDIDKQLSLLKGNEVTLMQCVTAYPSYPEQIDISHISMLKNRYNVSIGISDHSSTIYPCLAAATLGASVFEVHVTMSKYMFGPDVKASVTLEQLNQIVEGTRFIKKMLDVRKDMSSLNKEQEELKKIFSKSVFYRNDLKIGHVLSMDDVVFKKPNSGVDSSRVSEFIGKKLSKDVFKDELLNGCDFEE